ncbi:MAG: heat-shock protein Hsp20 [Bacteroidia bacterium]|nr:MAG: heat-shock protein Hsp20 [Bacteroidia bacterium]
MSNLTKRSGFFPSTLFDDFFTKDFFDWSNKNFSDFGSTLPSVNIKEADADYKIEMAVPGLKKDDFKIKLENNVLSISSEKKEEKEEKDKDGKYTRREYNYQSFCRTFTLPENTNADGIQADYKDGILKVVVPKKEITPAVPKEKLIEVK